MNTLHLPTSRNAPRLLLAVFWLQALLALPAFAQSPESAVVRITAKEGDRSKAGTGFIVQLTPELAYIVTASHVIEGDAEPQVEFFTRRDQPATASIKAAEVGDPKGLALLVVSGRQAIAPNLSVLALDADTPLKGGDEVTAIGFPRMGGDWAVSKGHLSARQGRELIFAMPVGEGNSGGPLLLNGKAVALVTSEAQGRAFAAPAASVKLFLEGSGVGVSASAPANAPFGELLDAPGAKPVAGAAPGTAPVSVEEALALMGEGQNETTRLTVLRDLVRKRSLTGPVSAGQMLSLMQGFGDNNRASAINMMKNLLAPNLTSADAAALMGESTQELARFRILQDLLQAGRIQRPIAGEDAVALLARFHDNMRISAISIIDKQLAAGLSVQQVLALMGAQEKEPVRHRVLLTVARGKHVKTPLSAEEKLQLVEGLTGNYRATALQLFK